MKKRETIALVSCVKTKAPGPCRARDLYTSALFRKMRAYAEQHADRWFILSAKHGLVDPDAVIARYEQTLRGATEKERRAWAQRVFAQMTRAHLLRPETTLLWLAGAVYKKHLSSLLHEFAQSDPLAGMKFGPRLAWLKRALAGPGSGSAGCRVTQAKTPPRGQQRGRVASSLAALKHTKPT